MAPPNGMSQFPITMLSSYSSEEWLVQRPELQLSTIVDKTMMGLANLARRSPTLIAFCPTDDNEYIYMGHSVSLYPTDPLNPLGFDSNLITLVGDDPNSCQPVALPAAAFERCDVRVKTIAEIRGANGFGAAPRISTMVFAWTSVRSKAAGGSATGWQELGSSPTSVMRLTSNPRGLSGCIGGIQ